MGDRTEVICQNSKIDLAFPSELLKGKELNFRGISGRDVLFFALETTQRPLWRLSENEFGPALYYTTVSNSPKIWSTRRHLRRGLDESWR
jgi:hypothetical protein